MTIEPAPLANVKAPPHSNEAEQSLLGAVMSRPSNYDRVADRITPEMFYRGVHRMAWQAIDEIARDGMQPDPVTVGEWFRNHGHFDKIENGAYLTMLANETPGSNALGWSRIIEDKHLRRRLIEAGTDIAEIGFSHGGVPLEDAQKKLQELDRPTGSDSVSIGQGCTRFLEYMDWLQANADKLVTTGLADVDRVIDGLLPADLVIAAGRPGMGKSIYGMLLARSNGRRGLPAQIFNLEMSVVQLIKREIAGGGVDNKRMRNPSNLTKDDWKRIGEVMATVKDLPIYIDETPNLTISQLRVRCRRAHRLRKVGLIIIDYLQLVRADGRVNSQEQEISEVSRGLKAIAKELQVPVVALAQLNRELEKRPDKRPKISDLRYSGQIEQDADIIQLLYFNGRYDETDESRILEIITAKHRDGEPSTSLVGYQPERFRMVNADLTEIGHYRSTVLNAPTGGGRKRPGFDLEDHS